MRKKPFVALAILALAAVLAVFGSSIIAYAEDGDATTADVASSSSPQDEGAFPMGNDYVWFGESLVLSDQEVANDLLAAGKTITIMDANASGSIRAAAQTITISDSKAAENITVAAQTVTLDNCTANVIAAVGSSVYVNGSCSEVTAYAQKVVIDGTVEGDVHVGADELEIGPNANIKGKLTVSASKEPTVDPKAKVGKVEFTKDEEASKEGAEQAAGGIASGISFFSIFVGIVGTIVVAVLAEWLFKRHTAAAAEMIRTRTGITIGTGIVGAIVSPIAIILMFILVVTIPVAVAVILSIISIALLAGGILGASVFKLVFPKLGRFKCALAGGAIVGVASAIPFLGILVKVAAFVYLFGYVLQSIFLGTRKKQDGEPALPPQPEA